MSSEPIPEQPPIIVTDAACDLPPATFEEYGIRWAPLRIQFGDESFRSGIDMTHAQFYDRLAHGDVHPTTSQPTVANFVELYHSLADQGRPLLSIHLSEGLSGTVNTARLAARQVAPQPVTVHDSGTLGPALGLQVLAAARAANAGRSVEQILPLLQRTHARGDLFFTVEDLSYLHRGGRIGGVRYAVGQVLHIKPIITVSKEGESAGTYIQAGRVRSLSRAIDEFVKKIAADVGEGGTLRAIAVYGDDATLAERLSAELAAHFNCVYLEMVPTAPVLGVHTGPGALGVGYAAGDWEV